MQYNIITIFPDWFESPLQTGLLGKADGAGLVKVNLVNPRDYTNDPHLKVDDRPYGGGPGMVLMAQPIVDAIRSIEKTGPIIALSPSGKPFTQKMAEELATHDTLTLICGRYEGFDERIYKILPITPVSVGDAILNGGEVAALAIIEATARLQKGFMGKFESKDEESFSSGLLEYPQYTRPENYEGHKVPEVLSGGNHAYINQWHEEKTLEVTFERRKELLDNAKISYKNREHLKSLKKINLGKNIYLAILHHPVMLKHKISGTTSLTNLDIHDIARSSCTYGVASFFVVTPLEDQQRLLRTLLDHWTQGLGSVSNVDRAQALSLVQPAQSLEEVIAKVAEFSGKDTLVIGTSAKEVLDKKGREYRKAMTFAELRELAEDNSVLILLGTGHGLIPETLEKCHGHLPPLRWMDTYNHLSVRAAAAILLDRLLGDLN